MNLIEKIQADTNNSMKSGDSEKTGTLRILQSEIKNAEIAKRASGNENLNDDEILVIINKEAKKRKDAIEIYKKGGRNELAEKEKKELEILSVYMPEQMAEEEIKKLVEEAIKQSGASGIQEIGKVMGVLMPKVKGKADGNLVSKIVKEKLG